MNFSFLKDLLPKAEEVRFAFPEVDFSGDFDELLSIISSNDYVDLSIGTNHLKIGRKTIPSVFVNMGKNDEKIEVMFFFDLADLKEFTPKLNADYLRNGVEEFKKTHQFEYFICQMDNAGADEYYFDSNGTGKLYNNL